MIHVHRCGIDFYIDFIEANHDDIIVLARNSSIELIYRFSFYPFALSFVSLDWNKMEWNIKFINL